MKRVLLTGATGFIGRHCLPALLANGYEVHAVSSKETQGEPSGVHWHRTDLLEPGRAFEIVAKVRPTHLLHLAWYAVPGRFWSSPENLHWVRTSLDLLEAFVDCGGQRMVGSGSCAEYDWRYGYCSERVTPLKPFALYGSCKHATRLVSETFAEQNGLSAAWGRIFFLYGPYEHPSRLVASVVNALLRGEPALCTHGNQIRDFLHVRDVAEAFVALLGSGVVGPVNVGSGEPVAIKDIVYKLARKLNKSELVRLGVVPAPVHEPPLLVADVDRLGSEVGWRPRYGLDSGLDQTIEWWTNHHFEQAG